MHPGYFTVLLWSLTILASFWGYGEALRRLLNRKEFQDLGWGLTMAWGMGVVLASGGLLLMFSWAKPPALASIVLAGAMIAAWILAQKLTLDDKSPAKHNPKKQKPKNIAEIIFTVWIVLLISITYLAGIAWPHQIDPNDDLVSYLMLPKKILGSGTLVEPFNFQRAGSYGGHHFLQALVMIFGGERNGHVPDMSWARLILVGIVYGMLRSRGGKLGIEGTALLTLLILLPVPRINTASSLTGAAMLLALFRTCQLCLQSSINLANPTCALPAAIVFAAGATMRPMILVAAGIFVLLLTLASTLRRDWSAARFAFFVGLLGALFLLPWATTLLISNGTILNPPFIGNVNPLFVDMSTRKGQIEDMKQAARFLMCWNVWPMILASLPLLFLRGVRGGRMAFLSVMSSVFLIAESCAVVITSEVLRYTFPLLIALAAFSLASLATVSKPLKPLPAVSLWALLTLLVLPNFALGAALARETVFGLPEQWRIRTGFFHPSVQQALLELQERVPAGEKILAVVDAPYYFDFSRNVVDTINSIGGAAPSGGLPVEKGHEALRRYLLEQGYRYVIAVDFNSAVLLYNRNHWLNHRRPEWYWREVWGRYALDFMKNMETIRDWSEGVVQSKNFFLIDLKTETSR